MSPKAGCTARASGSSKMAPSHMVVISTAAELQAASRVTRTDGVAGLVASAKLLWFILWWPDNACQPNLLCQPQAVHALKERQAQSLAYSHIGVDTERVTHVEYAYVKSAFVCLAHLRILSCFVHPYCHKIGTLSLVGPLSTGDHAMFSSLTGATPNTVSSTSN